MPLPLHLQRWIVVLLSSLQSWALRCGWVLCVQDGEPRGPPGRAPVTVVVNGLSVPPGARIAVTEGRSYSPSASSVHLCPGASGEGAGTPPLTVCDPVSLGPAEMGGFQEMVWQCSTLSVSAGARLSSSIGSDLSLEVGQAAARTAGLPPGHAWLVWLWFWLPLVSSSWSVSSDAALSASRLSPA